MQITSEVLEKAIEQLAKLPGTGRKSAQRIAMYLLKQSEESVYELSNALVDLKKQITRCSVCYNITDQDPCPICSTLKRETGVICVVEDFKDVYTIEKTNEFNGRYHVLGGVISPMENVGPDDLRIRELIQRVNGDEEKVEEVIIALNPDAEGEATAYYINKLLKNTEIQVTRIAYGIPMGTELEYIDEATLSRAFNSRDMF